MSLVSSLAPIEQKGLVVAFAADATLLWAFRWVEHLHKVAKWGNVAVANPDTTSFNNIERAIAYLFRGKPLQIDDVLAGVGRRSIARLVHTVAIESSNEWHGRKPCRSTCC